MIKEIVLNNDRKFYMTKNLAHAIHDVMSTMSKKEQIGYLSDFLYFLNMEDLAGLSDDLGVNQKYLVDNDDIC